MTTNVLASESAVAQVRPRTATGTPFFAVMSGVILLLVLSGFAKTLYLRPVFNPPAIPWYLFLHGIVLTSWFVWLFVQTMLIRSGRTRLHRRLGVGGAVLAAVVPFAGLMATAGVVGRIVGEGFALDADASGLGIGVSGTVIRFVSGVVWGNLSNVVSFAVLAWTGLALRRRTAAHKRLMLLATIAILGPALARLSRWAVFGASEQGPFIPIVVMSLFVATIVHDVVTTRRIHPATIFGIVFQIAVFSILSNAVAASNAGLAFVRWLQ
jgi:hypothetical protein